MFGSKEKKIEGLVRRNKWEVINDKFINSNVETRLLIAQKCANSKDPGVSNVLSILLRDTDDRVQLAAIKSIGETGKDHETAQLQWALSSVPESKTEIIAALHDALSKVKGRK